ncbi:conserved hypothetical protein [Vibrio nigripulchritudo SFn118]|nr:conserved hypothetical protein [Vibrio nigripulchritudo SFn118]
MSFVINHKKYRCSMENKQESKKEAGCLGYVIGGMSFIPLIGVLFGIIAILWGFAIKHTKLKIIGACGIAFTVILYSALGYFSFVQEGGVYDDLRGELTKTQLTSAVQAIEFYKVQNERYPESLEVLQKSLPENSMVFLHDAAQVNTQGKLYYYKLIDESSYHIRSYGRDGVLNTLDDILPSPIENVGLIVDYQVASGL